MSIEVPPGVKLTIATLLTVIGLVGAVRYARTVPSTTARKPILTAPPRPPPPRDVVFPRQDPPPATPEAVRSQPVTRESSGDLPEPSAAPLEDVIERAMPAVVMITTEKTFGSGFFVRPNLVVTNAHVVAGFTVVFVTTRNGAKVIARVTELSDEYDLALIQVAGLGPADAPLPLGQSSAVRLGQGVVVLGWAQSLTQSTVTRGIVTALGRDGVRQLIRTDAVPNAGDSGGPVLNRAGEVVGITTFRTNGAPGPAGYALAIDDVKPFIARTTNAATTVPPGWDR